MENKYDKYRKGKNTILFTTSITAAFLSSVRLPYLGELFYQTIHIVNQKDYTPEQLQAWAPTRVAPAGWHEKFLHTFTQIAVLENKIVGFGNLERTGYLDCLYVHYAYQSVALQPQSVTNSNNTSCSREHNKLQCMLPLQQNRSFKSVAMILYRSNL